MLSKMLRASRQSKAALNNTRNLLSTYKRNFSDESSLAASTPGSAAAMKPDTSYARNNRTLQNVSDMIRSKEAALQ